MRKVPLAIAVAAMAVAWLPASCAAQPQAVQGDSSQTGTEVASRDCGRVSLAQGEESPPLSYLTCIATAAEAGRPGTLTVVRPTTEGDAIATTYTVVAPGSVRVRLDATADKFAGTGARILEQTCDFRVDAGKIRTDGCTELAPA